MLDRCIGSVQCLSCKKILQTSGCPRAYSLFLLYWKQASHFLRGTIVIRSHFQLVVQIEAKRVISSLFLGGTSLAETASTLFVDVW